MIPETNVSLLIIQDQKTNRTTTCLSKIISELLSRTAELLYFATQSLQKCIFHAATTWWVSRSISYWIIHLVLACFISSGRSILAVFILADCTLLALVKKCTNQCPASIFFLICRNQYRNIILEKSSCLLGNSWGEIHRFYIASPPLFTWWKLFYAELLEYTLHIEQYVTHEDFFAGGLLRQS